MKTAKFNNVEITSKTINRNFRIKVNGIVNGIKVNTLVGVKGLLEILGGCWEKVVKFVTRALNCLEDKCTCKVYGGAKITFYAK